MVGRRRQGRGQGEGGAPELASSASLRWIRAALSQMAVCMVCAYVCQFTAIRGAEMSNAVTD